ncbi:MAG: hypothetical protein H8D45_02560 [Bacteroidetes bacterium]|nr:hypothetical protein [Bacteroidota bacterium]
MGECALKTEGIDIKKLIILKPDIPFKKTNEIESVRMKFSKRKNLPVLEEVKQPDRKAFDDIVFDTIGLTERERKEIYLKVGELVQKRLKKAKSV